MAPSPGGFMGGIRPLIMSVILLFPGHLYASDSLITWHGQVRARGELDGRDFRNETPPNRFALLRTRLGADIRPVRSLLVTIMVQDSRIFGQPAAPGSGNTVSNLSNIDLFRGFIRVSDFILDGISLQVGRFGLMYGEERIIGLFDWGNTGRSFDGAVLRYEEPDHRLDLFVTDVVDYTIPPAPVNRSTVAGMETEGLLFTGADYEFSGISENVLAAYGYYERSRAGTNGSEIDRERWTTGGRIKGKIDGFFYEGEGAYQIGAQMEADVSAFMVVGKIGYSFDDLAPLEKMFGGADWLSGTPAGSEKVQIFDPMFPTNHKFYGMMDYFTAIPAQTFNRGLQDFYAGFTLAPASGFTLSLIGHYFRLSETFVGRKTLGQEIDLVGNVRYNRFLSFELGAGGFIPDEIMRFEFGGDDPGWWGYAAAVVTF